MREELQWREEAWRKITFIVRMLGDKDFKKASGSTRRVAQK